MWIEFRFPTMVDAMSDEPRQHDDGAGQSLPSWVWESFDATDWADLRDAILSGKPEAAGRAIERLLHSGSDTDIGEVFTPTVVAAADRLFEPSHRSGPEALTSDNSRYQRAYRFARTRWLFSSDYSESVWEAVQLVESMRLSDAEVSQLFPEDQPLQRCCRVFCSWLRRDESTAVDRHRLYRRSLVEPIMRVRSTDDRPLE